MDSRFGLKEHVLNEIIEFARECGIEKLILFGSRSRNDFKPRSDIDLAINGGEVFKFISEIDERVETLLLFDIVNLNDSVQEELIDSIKREGVSLYEKYENFCRALKNLDDIYKYHEPYENVVMTGMVSLYEICFEQAWKAMKEILEEQGYGERKTGSPRMVIKLAYKAGMINHEEIWLQALVARNNVAHAYNMEIALSIINQSKELYVNMFKELKNTLESNWL